MAESKHSKKSSPKCVENLKSQVNPTKQSPTLKKKQAKHTKILKKKNISSTMQLDNDIAHERTTKKPQLLLSKTNDTDSTLQYSVDPVETENRSSSLKIYFPQQFSMLKNMDFLDNISDAENIIFDNYVYAICKDVHTAEQIYLSAARGMQFQAGKNNILSANRLGPVFCAFKSSKEDPTVLTIKKLPTGLSYRDLESRFPNAVDIGLKKTMAKVKFADIESCQKAWSSNAVLVWPKGAFPTVGNFPKESDTVESDEESDPNFLKFGHPKKFADDPCVVYLRLRKRFELSKGMAVFDILKSATDIILSRSCTLVYSDASVAYKRRQLLAGQSIVGGNVVAWISRLSDNDGSSQKSLKRSSKPVTDRDVASSEDEDKATPPPAKKMKKKKTPE